MRLGVIPVVVAVATVLAGCSSAGDTVRSSETTSATSTSATSSAATSTGPVPSSAATSTSPSAPASSTVATGGSDAGSAYCTELRSAKAEFESLNFQALDGAEFQRLTSEFDALASTAPAAVRDDWTTLSDALRQVRQILADAGLTFDDLRSLSAGQLPPGVKVGQLDKLSRRLQRFSEDTGFQTAAAAIASHAKSECGITMGS